MAQLTETQGTLKQMGIQHESSLDVIRDDILQLTREAQQNIKMQAMNHKAQLLSLKANLEKLRNEQLTCARHIAILRSLHFPEIRRRWYQIERADRRSNEWIFDPEETPFTPWLESLQRKDNLFYITGRVSFRELPTF